MKGYELMDNKATTIPPKILENLKKSKKHVNNITCFECGYVGMMGLKESSYGKLAAIIVSILLTVVGFAGMALFIGPVWSGLISIFSFFGFYQLFHRVRYICPNCEKELRPAK